MYNGHQASREAIARKNRDQLRKALLPPRYYYALDTVNWFIDEIHTINGSNFSWYRHMLRVFFTKAHIKSLFFSMDLGVWNKTIIIKYINRLLENEPSADGQNISLLDRFNSLGFGVEDIVSIFKYCTCHLFNNIKIFEDFLFQKKDQGLSLYDSIKDAAGLSENDITQLLKRSGAHLRTNLEKLYEFIKVGCPKAEDTSCFHKLQNQGWPKKEIVSLLISDNHRKYATLGSKIECCMRRVRQGRPIVISMDTCIAKQDLLAEMEALHGKQDASTSHARLDESGSAKRKRLMLSEQKECTESSHSEEAQHYQADQPDLAQNDRLPELSVALVREICPSPPLAFVPPDAVGRFFNDDLGAAENEANLAAKPMLWGSPGRYQAMLDESEPYDEPRNFSLK